MVELKKLNPKLNFKLFIVGPDWGSLKKELIDLRNKHSLQNEVKFLGAVKDIRKVYAKSDYFVSASEYESFGISLVEAMAQGLIPIVQKIESFENIIDR